MTHVPVKSSNLVSVAYDPKTQTLQVKFHSGAVHNYSKVPAATHAAMLKAKSVGSFFHSKVKDSFKSEPVSLAAL
jgi:hypothetical protein